jgi:hypothetical protein
MLPSILTHSTKTKQANYPSIDLKAYLMRSVKDSTVMSWTNNLQSLILIAVASSVDHPSLTGTASSAMTAMIMDHLIQKNGRREKKKRQKLLMPLNL